MKRVVHAIDLPRDARFVMDRHGTPSRGGGDHMDRLLTRDEVAELLQKPPSWLRYSERRKIVPYVKIGQHIRYRSSDVDAWIAQHAVRAEPSVPR
jgi:predicted DNA-binding transcriptional regulator AlpA